MALTTRAFHFSARALSTWRDSVDSLFIPRWFLYLLTSLFLLLAILVPLWVLRSAVKEVAASRPLPEGSSGSLHPEMLILPTGTFMMGSPPGEEGRGDDETQHRVTITQKFAISVTEVTQGQFRRVMGFNPSKERDLGSGNTSGGGGCATLGVGDELPVACVTFVEAAEYANMVSGLAQLEQCYEIMGETVEWPSRFGCKGYRLPTEAEWEYAARADTRFRYAGTDLETELCKFANLKTNDCKNGGAEYLSQVRHLQPNAWGLYDMSGNVEEWVWDWYSPSGLAATTDPTGPDTGSTRVNRGGAWNTVPRNVRVSARAWYAPSGQYGSQGFRLARSYP